ncbi:MULTISPECIES: hypothetical protein [unclassified Halomonas]|uniref:hypothetical protein n=1 Tax=unclassified Halomonas TaxID=2609666 RepID=UPI0009904004|nr:MULTISPECIES: hypothetical protein [unclassified Halomonas]AQU84920.1 hypothetical protein B2G49_21430 [Halomonas sp. 'Soap Lake \
MENVNKGLIFGFAVIAAVAIGAYTFQFWGWPLSRNPSDWAHFATYLSGTVGVTAVVATLIVLVRTLGQQQALIDSQSKMLEKQEGQLKLTQQQVDGEESRRQVELAYNCAINIVPTMINELEKQKDMTLINYLGKEGLDIELPREADLDITIRAMLKEEDYYAWLEHLQTGWMVATCQAIIGNAYRLGVIVSDCLYVASELEDYFRAIIGAENFRLIRCGMLFNKNMPGSNFNKHQRSLRIVDGQQSNDVEQFWHDLGEKVYKKQPTD